jgi:DNA-binding CsgD family transcriptional regulator
LQKRFGLTPAEARLAAHMVNGSALTDVAGTLRIAKETAERSSRGVFRKTGTCRQAELVALLAGINPRRED